MYVVIDQEGKSQNVPVLAAEDANEGMIHYVRVGDNRIEVFAKFRDDYDQLMQQVLCECMDRIISVETSLNRNQSIFFLK